MILCLSLDSTRNHCVVCKTPLHRWAQSLLWTDSTGSEADIRMAFNTQSAVTNVSSLYHLSYQTTASSFLIPHLSYHQLFERCPRFIICHTINCFKCVLASSYVTKEGVKGGGCLLWNMCTNHYKCGVYQWLVHSRKVNRSYNRQTETRKVNRSNRFDRQRLG